MAPKATPGAIFRGVLEAAKGVDRSAPIILNKMGLALTCIIAAAISSPALALTGRNLQVYLSIIFRA
jgi:hypothetical protein